MDSLFVAPIYRQLVRGRYRMLFLDKQLNEITSIWNYISKFVLNGRLSLSDSRESWQNINWEGKKNMPPVTRR